MAHLNIDKVFAENLGYSFGGCVRDQTIGMLYREAAKSMGVRLCPIPFCGTGSKLQFQSRWSALLQAIAAWAVLNTLPEYTADEKLLRKTVFNMQIYSEQMLVKTLFNKINVDQQKEYAEWRRDFMHIGQQKKSEKEDFSKAFLMHWYGQKEEELDPKLVHEFSYHVGMANRLFEQLANIAKNEPNAYERTPGQKK